jgi:hypothetical protein
MGRDESGTPSRLREHRKEQLELTLARYDEMAGQAYPMMVPHRTR